MDGKWLEWRHLDGLWELYEEKGWGLGPVRRVQLPPAFAESGAYRILFRYRDRESGESLFEVSEIREGEEHGVVLVWGVPTPEQARELLERYGMGPDDEPRTEARGSWAGILPPVVHLSESFRES